MSCSSKKSGWERGKRKFRNFFGFLALRYEFYVTNVFFSFHTFKAILKLRNVFFFFILPYIIEELIKSIHIHKQGLRYPFSTRSQKESKLNFLLFTFYLFLTVESVMCSKWLDIVLEGRRVLHCTVV